MNEVIGVYVMSADGKREVDGELTVVAHYRPGYRETRYEPAEPADYEVEKADLKLTDDIIHCLDGDGCLTIQVPGQRRVVVGVSPDDIKRREASLDDVDLTYAISDYLLER